MTRLIFLTVCIGALLGTSASAQISEPDVVGVYFDTAYTLTEADTPTVPAVQTAYLVLHNPSRTEGGLGGWECRLRFTNIEPMVQWNLAGDVFNFETPPAFFVGMISPLPITGPDVLLMSFDLHVETLVPMGIELLPVGRHSSIEDAMCYIPFDDKEALTPMATTTGTPLVAGLNWAPDCELDRYTLDFGNVPAGGSRTEYIRVTNMGGDLITVDPFFDPPDSALEVVSPPGTVYLATDESVDVGIRYAPTAGTQSSVQLELGTGCSSVLVAGRGISPSLIFSPADHDFGQVEPGESAQLFLRVFNSGYESITAVASLDDPDGVFRFDGEGEPAYFRAGNYTNFTIFFEPSVFGTFDGLFRLEGTGLSVPLNGVCEISYDGVIVDPEQLDFGPVAVGSDALAPVVVTNDNPSAVELVPSLAPDSGHFALAGGGDPLTVAPGGTHTIEVRAQPQATGNFQAELRLGLDLPVVPLSVLGTVEAPECQLSATSIEFPPTRVGYETTRSLTVTNTGNANMDVEGHDCSAYVVLTPAFTLAPDESGTLVVAFRPTDAGDHTCLMDLGSNPCDGVELTGNAYVWTPGDNVAATDLDLYPGSIVPPDYRTWLTARLELPPEYDPADVLWETARCNEAVPADSTTFAWDHDFNGNGIPDLRLKFPLDEVHAILPEGREVPITVTGELRGGTVFTAEGTILVIRPKLLIPDGNEDYVSGTDVMIAWETPRSWQDALVDVLFTSNGGGTWELLATGLNGTKFAWRTPGLSTSRARIRVRFSDDGRLLGFDSSDETFSITARPVAAARPGPTASRLVQAQPNPFNPRTMIHFELAKDGRVRIDVFDVMGRRVASLLNEDRSAGPGQVTWHGRNDRGRVVSSGSYYVRLETAGVVDTRKVLLLK